MRLLKCFIRDARYVLSPHYLSSAIFLTRLNMKRQYRESFLGMLWSLIQPSIHIVVLSFVFSFMMHAPVPHYSLYVMGGMLPWTLLVTSFNGGAQTLLLRADVIRGGCVLPKTMFIVAGVLVNVYIFFISTVVMYLVLGLFFAPMSWSILLWPFVVLPIIGTCICAAIAFGYIAPYVKDTGHLILILMNALFWTVPIAYPIAMVAPENRHLFGFNPLYILIRPVQMLVHDGVFPPVFYIGEAFGVMGFTLLAAWAVHHWLRRDVIYYL